MRLKKRKEKKYNVVTVLVFQTVSLYCIKVDTQCYYHRGTRLNAMNEEVLYLQPMIPPKRFDISLADWGMLRRSRCVQIFL